MSIKREFGIGEIAHLKRNIRARGFMLQNRQEVKIVGYKKIKQDAGAYMYDIEVLHPKTDEHVLLEGWVSQFDLIPKWVWEEISLSVSSTK